MLFLYFQHAIYLSITLSVSTVSLDTGSRNVLKRKAAPISDTDAMSIPSAKYRTEPDRNRNEIQFVVNGTGTECPIRNETEPEQKSWIHFNLEAEQRSGKPISARCNASQRFQM